MLSGVAECRWQAILYAVGNLAAKSKEERENQIKTKLITFEKQI